jgi:preprotein translocase subunit SecG
MASVIIAIHIIVCFALILIVLLQTGKGAEMGAAFGGASQTIFGSSGPAGFLGKLTAGAAVVFMLTSLSLAYLSSHRPGKTIFEKTPAPATRQIPEAALPPEESTAYPEEEPGATGAIPAGEEAAPVEEEQSRIPEAK